jgi:hypothetical protein
VDRTPAGLVEHLIGAEWRWFQEVVSGIEPEPFAGEEVPAYDPTAAFVSGLPSGELIAAYREQCAQSEAVLAATLPGHRQGADRRQDRAGTALSRCDAGPAAGGARRAISVPAEASGCREVGDIVVGLAYARDQVALTCGANPAAGEKGMESVGL